MEVYMLQQAASEFMFVSVYTNRKELAACGWTSKQPYSVHYYWWMQPSVTVVVINHTTQLPGIDMYAVDKSSVTPIKPYVNTMNSLGL